MNKNLSIIHNEQGFALVAVLVSLILLIVVGITSMMSSSIDRDVAGSDKTHTDTFYDADSGLSIATEVLELENDATPEALVPVAVRDTVSPTKSDEVVGVRLTEAAPFSYAPPPRWAIQVNRSGRFSTGNLK